MQSSNKSYLYFYSGLLLPHIRTGQIQVLPAATFGLGPGSGACDARRAKAVSLNVEAHVGVGIRITAVVDRTKRAAKDDGHSLQSRCRRRLLQIHLASASIALVLPQWARMQWHAT